MQEKLVEEKNQNLNEVMTLKSTNVMYLCGMRAVGKSTLLSALMDEMPRFVIYDGSTHQHGDKGIVVRNATELDRAMKSGEKRIICQPWQDNEEVFDTFCRVVWENGNCHLAVEEIGNYLDSFKCPVYADMIIRVGRNKGIGMTGINQRPARIWNNFIALTDHWFIFKTTLPRDVKFICEYIGDDKEQILKELPDHYFIYMSAKTMKPIKCNPIKIKEAKK